MLTFNTSCILKVIYLMSHEGNIVKDVAKYITLAMNIRKKESALM